MAQDILNLGELRPAVQHDAGFRMAEGVGRGADARQAGVAPDDAPDGLGRQPVALAPRPWSAACAVVPQEDGRVAVIARAQVLPYGRERFVAQEHDALLVAFSGD